MFAPLAVAGGSPVSKDIALVVKQGRGTPEGRAAWERLSQASPDALLPILRAMDGADTSASNWLRTVLDRIVLREQAKAQSLPIDDLLAFAKDVKQPGRARRLALELVEQERPGVSARLFASRLDDPEFRFDAVALALASARQHLKKGAKDQAGASFRQAFEAARDVQQARDAAAGLEQLGVKVNVGEHLGFLMDWRLIGPFDGGGQKGFHLTYPPEKRVDLSEQQPGQGGKTLRWTRYHVTEPPHASGAKHQALVNLAAKEALGNADDAVAFAYTEFTVAQGSDVEFRGAADDHFTVWVNGKRVFGFEEWRNGVRLDRHRFQVSLRAGKNTVLVKVCQSAAPNPEPNWEFFLRVVDATGKGIAMKNVIR